jgi:dTDP-glucose 4,6-dehydratase/UDP-glucose 4-epimerase
MQILIIGSKGFIGSHAMCYFSTKHSVWGADIVNEYNEKNYFQVDSTNANFHTIFQSQPFDVCINCSGAASVPASLENPLRDFELNTNNVFKILSAIKLYSPECRFLNMSSAAVYGNPSVLPITEKQPLNPISPYGKHKLFAEEICREFYEMFTIRSLSLRIFSAYGEGLKKQFFWDLFKKSQSGSVIELWGTGNESRDFIYINDIMQVIELAIKNDYFYGNAVNVANQLEVKMADAAKMFFKQYNQNNNYFFNGKTREGDPLNWCADISIIKSWGYNPQFSLNDGLLNYTQWLRNI